MCWAYGLWIFVICVLGFEVCKCLGLGLMALDFFVCLACRFCRLLGAGLGFVGFWVLGFRRLGVVGGLQLNPKSRNPKPKTIKA